MLVYVKRQKHYAMTITIVHELQSSLDKELIYRKNKINRSS